jgi:hypothetical protein
MKIVVWHGTFLMRFNAIKPTMVGGFGVFRSVFAHGTEPNYCTGAAIVILVLSILLWRYRLADILLMREAALTSIPGINRQPMPFSKTVVEAQDLGFAL